MTDRIKLLTELLELRKNSDKLGITFIEGGNQEEFLSYKGLYDEALKCLWLVLGHFPSSHAQPMKYPKYINRQNNDL